MEHASADACKVSERSPTARVSERSPTLTGLGERFRRSTQGETTEGSKGRFCPQTKLLKVSENTYMPRFPMRLD